MRPVLVALSLVGLATLPLPAEEAVEITVDQVLKRSGKEYIAGLEQIVAQMKAGTGSRASFDELARLLESFPAPGNKAPSEEAYRDGEIFTRAFQRACVEGGPVQIDRLIDLFAHAPASGDRSEMLPALAELWIAREIEVIAAEAGEKPVFPEIDQPLPESAQKMPEALQKAALLWHAIAAPGTARREATTEGRWIAYQDNEDAFWASALALLRGDTKEAPQHLQQFRWKGSCGMGSTTVEEPKILFQIMTLLRERQLAKAVGALFVIAEVDASREAYRRADGSLQRRLLQICGLDWEQVYLGSILNPFSDFGGGGSQVAGQIATLGSPEAVRLLAASVPFEDRLLIPALAAALGPAPIKPSSDPGAISNPNLRPRRAPLPAEVTQEIIDALAAWTGVARDEYGVFAAIEPLQRFVTPATTEALTRLLDHPSDEIARQAAEALRERGIETPERKPRPPLRFTLAVGGLPLANRKVKYKIESDSFTHTYDGETDARGMLELPPEVRPEKESDRLVVGIDNESEESRPLTSPIFTAVQPWPKPAPAGEAVPISIRTQPVTLLITYPRAMPAFAGKKLLLRLSRKRLVADYSSFPSDAVFAVPASSRVELPSVQEGFYEVSVQVPGAAKWGSGEIEVAGRPYVIEANLTAGSDVSIKPHIAEGDPYIIVELWRGKERDFSASDFRSAGRTTFRNLPVGRYRFRIPSSEEHDRIFDPDPDEIVLTPKPAWAAAEVTFEITDSSPAKIDLGQIDLPLPPAKPGR